MTVRTSRPVSCPWEADRPGDSPLHHLQDPEMRGGARSEAPITVPGRAASGDVQINAWPPLLPGPNWPDTQPAPASPRSIRKHRWTTLPTCAPEPDPPWPHALKTAVVSSVGATLQWRRFAHEVAAIVQPGGDSVTLAAAAPPRGSCRVIIRGITRPGASRPPRGPGRPATRRFRGASSGRTAGREVRCRPPPRPS